jgi:uncharacterized delta-60 repeat protein
MPKSLLCLFLVLLLGACGGGGDDESADPAPPPPPGTIGPAGGTVTGPGGTRVVVPANALTQAIVINIAQTNAGAPALPAGVLAVSNVFEFTPHGTSFASPATVTVPFDPTLVPAGTQLTMHKTNAAGTGWEEVSGATVSGNTMTGSINGFSWIFLSRLPPPVEDTDQPQRFFRLDGIDLGNALVELAGNMDDEHINFGEGAPPGEFLETARFGLLPLAIGGDFFADGEVFSTEDGKTYWADAEAPSGDLLGQTPERTFLGSRSMLRIDQSYRKNASDATLELVLTQAAMLVADFNAPGPRLAGCPWSGAPENTLEDCNDLLSAELGMEVWVIQGSERTRAVGEPSTRDVYQTIRGSAVHRQGPERDTVFEVFRNDKEALTPSQPDFPRHESVWEFGDFEKVVDGSVTEVHLREPLRLKIDLSKVEECVDPNDVARCPEFTVRTTIYARTINRRAGETYARARLRDPVNADGVQFEATGLRATNSPLIGDIELNQPPPPQCSNGTDPAAGNLQLNAAEFRIMEFGMLQPRIFVLRQGGSAGDAVATVRSRDGTARAGTHYSAIEQTVFFEDGDTVPRAITLPLIANNSNDGNVELELELSAQAGCATLGDTTTATVTIVDDEAIAGPPPESGSLDTTFGVAGEASSAPFGGNDSKMALQADGKIVIVGGSFVDFVLARFTADGTLDSTFGSGGQVTTDISGGLVERARAVAIQSDGKIVVAGEGTIGSSSVVALTRYNPDGSLDTGFGAGGKVLETTIRSRAFAVAVQPDGKIVVAGDAFVPGNPNDVGDALVARYNSDGSIDTSFGDAGQRVIDITVGTDLARNLVLQPNGAIVIAGDPFGSDPDDRTGVARFDANGNLDSSFGAAGKVILSSRIGRGLALQPDGKLLLVGPSSVLATSQFAMTRLNADGTIDTGFGSAGLVSTSVSNATIGAGDIAQAVALHPDGRIYVAGVAGSLNRNFGLARYSSNGTLDTSFSTDGVLTVDFDGQTDSAESVAVLSNGKIVLSGVATPTSNDGYGVIRVNP